MIQILFWILIILVFYVYIGYTLVLFIVSILKKVLISDTIKQQEKYEPAVTVFIAAYNENEVLSRKIENLRLLDYPKDKLKFLWITDGSDDGSDQYLQNIPGMEVLHETERKGKIGAMNRGMKYVNTPIVLFCDANNMLVPLAVRKVIEAFSDITVGCVAGEKQIIKHNSDIAVSSGEGIYWQYESSIKKLESEINSTIGAAGEIFAIRTDLFEEVEPDTVLDDFVISLRIAQKGYKIKYVPGAIAIETSSASISEELKRKIRIAAGCLQTIPRLKSLLNPFRFGFLSFQYWSHKILRWTFVPFALIFILPLNFYIVIENHLIIYDILLYMQLIFYSIATIGFAFRKHSTTLRVLFIPYYMLVMNAAIIIGFFRYFRHNQSVNWEKAVRS
jgi:cellulose synthase/poly-beta-1,6-N-acetylglucosamine synthase-like glycosyltransferase